MGSDVSEVIQALPSPRNIKVHRSMCAKLIQLVERIINIFPEIEAYRPRCSSGIQALCSLRNGIEKAKLLLQHCCEDSTLYLAIKGEATLLRCKNTRNLLEQSLSYIQNNVPVTLAAKISPILSDLRGAKFSVDSIQEEAGKAMRTFLQNYASSSDSLENTAVETLKFAFLSLQITSQRALLKERRSVNKLLEKASDKEASKKNILFYLLVLLKKYGKSIVNELLENPDLETLPLSKSSENFHFEDEPTGLRNDDMSERGVPPEEYKCPISLRLMFDPVVISSGVTFERMWIEKWFNEGNDTCPKTKTKLENLSLTPNNAMKELILKWGISNGVSIPDPDTESTENQSWDTSVNSIASLSNSMNNLHLAMNLSQVSVGSLDSNSSINNSWGSSNYKKKCLVFEKLDELSWECQCETVEDMKEILRHDSFRVENFVGLLIRFLKRAFEKRDGKARRSGTQLFLAFVSECRNSIPNLPEEVYGLLASLLESEVTSEALAILELVSLNPCCRSQILESGVLYPILEILETQAKEFLEPVMKILNSLSLSTEIRSFIAPSKFIPKLVPLIQDDTFARYSISMLRNLCQYEDTRVCIAETSGCIGSIARLLDSGSEEVQENAVIVLLSMCSQREDYCRMVMEEEVICSLSFISQNGNEKGKASALELLRNLRNSVDSDDVGVVSSLRNSVDSGDDTQESSRRDLDSSGDSFDNCEEKKSSTKGQKYGIFSMFSKHKSKAKK